MKGARPVPVPGLPQDGEPLTFEEQRALGFVETDSWIDVAEPKYSNGGTA